MEKEYNTKYKIKWKETISRVAWLAESRDFAYKIRLHQGNPMNDVDRIIELDNQNLEDRFSIWKDD
ncbi:MAG: hypothetical protein CVU41_17930 [Chloroflexi bacterium HGW-Chloroflexi-3]|nr:MAG: hypothetical protein CVU41_17930 [Chloroflexi bacterium HGW-Chloroflexi-3]